jgi:AraC-like DNA-binding protein
MAQHPRRGFALGLKELVTCPSLQRVLGPRRLTKTGQSREGQIMFRRTTDADEYFGDPKHSLLSRSGFFCSSPDGLTLTLWGVGHADLQGVEDLLEIYAAVERARFPPRRQLVVLRHLRSISSAAMWRFVRYHERVSAYLRGVTHEAVVRPDGVVGVVAEGFYRVVPHPADGRVFTALDDALQWVGIDDPAWVKAMLSEESNLRARLEHRPELLDALWAPRFMALSIEEAAAALGLSTRTLQRRLRVLGTTFETLRLRATLDEAAARLVAGQSIKEVAFGLGFSSPSAFSTSFRRTFGVSPEQWRSAQVDDPTGGQLDAGRDPGSPPARPAELGGAIGPR